MWIYTDPEPAAKLDVILQPCSVTRSFVQASLGSETTLTGFVFLHVSYCVAVNYFQNEWLGPNSTSLREPHTHFLCLAVIPKLSLYFLLTYYLIQSAPLNHCIEIR